MILYIITFILGIVFGAFGFFIISIKTELMDTIHQKIELKKYDREQRIQFERDAKASIQQDLMKDYAKHLRQKELDKLTGKAKKDKLKKFADAFSSGGSSGNQDFLSKMGMGQNGNVGNTYTPQTQSRPTYQDPPRQQHQQPVQPQYKEPKQQYQQPVQPQKIPGDTVTQMFGIEKGNKKRTQKEEFERLNSFMR